MLCLGFEPEAAEWKLKMKPWSYGGRPFNWYYAQNEIC